MNQAEETGTEGGARQSTFESSGCSPWVRHARRRAFNLHDGCQRGGAILSVYTEGKLRLSRDLLGTHFYNVGTGKGFLNKAKIKKL